jgi:hypothetical protein
MDGIETKIDLNVLHLRSYDLIIGMEWLEKYVVVVNCKNKTFDCLDELGKRKTIKGIPRSVSLRKGWEIYIVHINENQDKLVKNMLTDDPILREFQDLFPEEILGLPPTRDIDFPIDLVSKEPYMMSVPRDDRIKNTSTRDIG